MGITEKSLARLARLNKEYVDGKSMLQIGCQNIYTQGNNGGLAHTFFENAGLKVRTVDITGCQGSEIMDLRIQQDWSTQYDIVTDFGCGEHVDGNFYMFNKNIHDACKVGGIIIRENPKTGNWPGHGCNYLDKQFYIKLAEKCGYEILELTEEAAMGNVTDGWNISVVLRKVEIIGFMTPLEFDKIPVYDK